MSSKELTTIQTIMRNEYVWLASVIIAVMGFVSQVILPIQKMQIQLADIQITIAQNKVDYQSLLNQQGVQDIKVAQLENRISVLETEIKTLIK